MSGPFRNFVSADPFRPSMSVKLRYTDTTTLLSGLNGHIGDVQTFRLNSLYDPDLSGVGTQPYGYDQLATLYRKYKVHGASIEVVFTDPDQDGMLMAIQLRNPSNVYSMAGKNVNDLREQPMTVVRTINNSGKQRVAVKQYVPISTVSGLTKLQFQADNDLFVASTTANPTAQPLFTIGVGSSRLAQNATMICRTTITYYATMYERIVHVASS